MENLTQCYFNISKPDLEFVDIRKNQFTKRKKVLIASLCPNQKEVDPLLINYKRKNKNLTTPYVLFYKGYNILMDGHHTTIAKKLNGQKYVYALTLTILD